jgi:hypothetical protein
MPALEGPLLQLKEKPNIVRHQALSSQHFDGNQSVPARTSVLRRTKSFQVVVRFGCATRPDAVPAQDVAYSLVGQVVPPGCSTRPPSGRNPSRSSREPSEPRDPRSVDWCAAGRASRAVWSFRIFGRGFVKQVGRSHHCRRLGP